MVTRRSGFWNVCANRIAQREFSRSHNISAPPAMPPHRVVSAVPQRGLHPRTWCARARDLQNDVTDANRTTTQCGEVDPGNHKVAPQKCRIDRLTPDQGGNYRQMLCLDQGDRTLAGPPVVPLQAILGRDSARNRFDRRQPDRPKADPIEAPVFGMPGNQGRDAFHGLSHSALRTRLPDLSSLDWNKV